MLSGDNGILQKATDAKTRTERATIIENAQTDILGQQAENKGKSISKQQLKSVLENYFNENEVEELTIPNDISTSNDELTSKDGKYRIKLSEIYNGNFYEYITKISITELIEGDEVIYTDKNGNSIPCIVLYDSTSTYGIQIISKNIVGEQISIGNGTNFSSDQRSNQYFEIARESYNTAIAKLNSAAKNYLNIELATSARCVGSSPSEEVIYEEDNTGTYTNNATSSFSSYNNKFKPSDSYVSSTTGDYAQMVKVRCQNLSSQYWLASRNVQVNGGLIFYIRCVSSGSFAATSICNYKTGMGEYSKDVKKGLRPIFTLNSSIHYIEENGIKTLIK